MSNCLFDFLRRLRALHRLSRGDRGQELDRVLKAMEEGARFQGASGVMLLTMAKDRGWNEHWMKREGRRALDDDLLGHLYAKRVSGFIRDTRNDPVQEGLVR